MSEFRCHACSYSGLGPCNECQLRQRVSELEARLRIVDGLEPVHIGEVERALAEDDSLLFISYDELRVKLDELDDLQARLKGAL